MAALLVLGALILLHAGYSSYEYHAFVKTKGTFVPTEIILEVVIGLVIINFGALFSIKSKPRLGITHDKVVQPPSNFLMPIDLSEASTVVNSLGVTDYEELETRRDFVDVKKKRKEYAEWLAKQEA
ncbi:hypothetical protein FT663_03514 [Candidozyma haemuli var. vulneris]|uniref:ER membrane protein complex subunit 5 n=1 Tax=Candidozyma haemuli TaxID=45357 RepID=A0A2V1ATH9_9ASCO|nr:hypothetical protein CXQ85_000367 [[Candida] haemuloni]KAF3988200.1 hypothetical protein FT662_03546 [[Candida] haemuloni var. vulneris]KAF3989658.1 hypothetical protein FT663_03514 [[Candida] haemuloni var. vulneris]PVH21390.1 hypothetical protein CXQ85_000367 [[Candida] haemuloni]